MTKFPQSSKEGQKNQIHSTGNSDHPHQQRQNIQITTNKLKEVIIENDDEEEDEIIDEIYEEESDQNDNNDDVEEDFLDESIGEDILASSNGSLTYSQQFGNS